VLLIVTAVQNPEGIAGAVRAKAALAQRQRAARTSVDVDLPVAAFAGGVRARLRR
jgi:hypothetical protein